MSRNAWKVVLVIVVVVLGVWLLGGKGTSDASPIKIGFIGPMTGDAGNIGENAKAGVEIAVAEVNAAGGVNGRQLEVIYEDGKCNGGAAVSAAQKLIGVDKVSVILGGACSGETAAFAPVAEQAKTTVISYCSSAPSITTAGDYIFRDYPSDTFQGAFAADYIKNTLGKSKVSVLYVNSDWGAGIKEVFNKKFVELGGTIVSDEGYVQTATDFRSNIAKIKVAKPELVYFLGYAGATTRALQQFADQKVSLPLFGGDGWDDSKIPADAGKLAEGIMYSVPSNNPSATFKASMKAKVGSDEIAACTPTAYDAVNLLAQVMKKVGSDSTAIKNELYKTTYTGGVSTKSISFDENGDLKAADYVVKVIKNGKAEILK